MDNKTEMVSGRVVVDGREKKLPRSLRNKLSVRLFDERNGLLLSGLTRPNGGPVAPTGPKGARPQGAFAAPKWAIDMFKRQPSPGKGFGNEPRTEKRKLVQTQPSFENPRQSPPPMLVSATAPRLKVTIPHISATWAQEVTARLTAHYDSPELRFDLRPLTVASVPVNKRRTAVVSMTLTHQRSVTATLADVRAKTIFIPARSNAASKESLLAKPATDSARSSAVYPKFI